MFNIEVYICMWCYLK